MEVLTGEQVPSIPDGTFAFTMCLTRGSIKLLWDALYYGRILYDNNMDYAYPFLQALNFSPPCLECSGDYLEFEIGQQILYQFPLAINQSIILGANARPQAKVEIRRHRFPFGLKAGYSIELYGGSGEYYLSGQPTDDAWCWRGWHGVPIPDLYPCPSSQTTDSGWLDTVLEGNGKLKDGLSYLAPMFTQSVPYVASQHLYWNDQLLEPATFWETSEGNGDGVYVAYADTPNIGMKLNINDAGWDTANGSNNTWGGIINYTAQIRRVW